MAAEPTGAAQGPGAKPALKPSARKMREAAVTALAAAQTPAGVKDETARGAEAPEGAAAPVDDVFANARRRVAGLDLDILPEDRLRAEDLLAAIASRARLLEQLLGNALASAFAGEEPPLDRAALRALALPLLAELTGERRSTARQLVESYASVAATLPGGDEPGIARLLGQLATEVSLMKSSARLAAVQALYQMEVSGQPLGTVREQFESLRIGAEIDGATYREADIDLFRRILDDALARQAAIDQLTDRTLVDRWPLGRVDATLRALFRAAGAELTAAPKTPPKVVISEYVDVARAFFPEGKEPGLVNAVLDAMARELRPDAFA